MPQIIELPDGIELEVPDDLSGEQMDEVVEDYYASQGGQGAPESATFPAGDDGSDVQSPAPSGAGDSGVPQAQGAVEEEDGFSFWDYVPLVSQARDVMDIAEQGFEPSDQFPYFALPESVGERVERRNDVTDVAAPLVAGGAGAGAGAGMALKAGLGRAMQVLASGAGAGAADTAMQAAGGEFDAARAVGATVGGTAGAAGGLAAGPAAAAVKEGAKLAGLYGAGTAAEAVGGPDYLTDMLIGGRLLSKSRYLQKMMGITKKVTKTRAPKTQTSITTDLTAAAGAAGGGALASQSEGAP